MMARLKRNNDSIFITLLLVLLASSSWFFINQSLEKKLNLTHEVKKIEAQEVLFNKQNTDLLNLKKQTQENIDNFLKLQLTIQENKTEEVKQELNKNTKSSNLLSILPPSEIATIQQNESHKKITEEITALKASSALFWDSISKMGNENVSETSFSIGNIKDNSLKNSLYTDLSSFLKKEKELFNTFTSYDNSFEKFTQSSEGLTQVYPLLKTQQIKNKKLLNEALDSLDKELQIIQIASAVGFVSLLIVLIFVVSRKKKYKAPVSNHQGEDFEPTISISTKKEDLLSVSLYDKSLSLINVINQTFNKQINLHFDMDNFESLTLSQQDKLTSVVLELVKFSGLYSFTDKDSGDIIISLKEEQGSHTFLFKDNGKGLFVEDIKEKIKQQYSVNDNVFVGKTNQQIFSFIFKPNFVLVQNEDLINTEKLQLNLVSQVTQEINGKISLSTQENNGTEFLINFQSV